MKKRNPVDQKRRLMMYGLAIALTALFTVVNAVVLPEALTIRGKRSRELSGSGGFTCFGPVVNLNFENTEIVTNNLGGWGPGSGSPVIHFADVGQHGTQTIDLVISIKPGSTYQVNNSTRNGLKDSNKTGVINLKSNTETKLLFTFYENGSYETNDPKIMVLPAFKISIFLIDMSPSVTEYLVEGWDYALYDDNNIEIHFNETDDLCSGVGNCLYAKSLGLGAGCDNPFDPMELSTNFTCTQTGREFNVNQLARSFQVEFKDESGLELFLLATERQHMDRRELGIGNSGRNFVWAFDSAWTENCTEIVHPGAQCSS